MGKLELYIKDIILGRRRGIIPFFIKALLLPLSWLYGWGVFLRNRAYEKGWMRRYVPPVPLVISIGNIVAGGTGKTPVTLLLVSAFYEKIPIAILSRGYRSQVEKLDTPVILSDGHGPIFPASYCGDEPYLYAKRFPKAIVIVGGNRRKASFLAARAGATAIFLDDAMQHRKLARDFDVVVIDASDPFGMGYFLPRGFLRDDIRSLSRANLIILNHINDDEQFSKAKQELQAYTTAPMVGTRGVVTSVRDFLNDQEIETTQKTVVGMFCSIAHPSYFKRTLEQKGFHIVDELIFADHGTISEKKLEKFAQSALKKGAKWLICTEKDRVKLTNELPLSLPIAWVKIDLSIVAGQKEWDHFLQLAKEKIS